MSPQCIWVSYGKTIQPAISTSASLPSVHKIKSQFEMKILFARSRKIKIKMKSQCGASSFLCECIWHGVTGRAHSRQRCHHQLSPQSSAYTKVPCPCPYLSSRAHITPTIVDHPTISFDNALKHSHPLPFASKPRKPGKKSFSCKNPHSLNFQIEKQLTPPTPKNFT